MTISDWIELYKNRTEVKQIVENLSEDNAKINIDGLAGSSASFVASGIFSNQPGNYLFILPEKEEAAYFYNNLENINESDKATNILFYPATYRRPYHIEETDNSNIMLRAEVLSVIQKKRKNTIIVTYPEAILEKVVTKKNLSKHTFEIEVSKDYSIDFVNELLVEYDFERVDYVYEPGQFSIRGGIVDIYSYSNENPFRIEFFGDEVDSIRTFDTLTQLSIKTHKKISVIPNVQKKLLEESRESFLNFIPNNTIIWAKNLDIAFSKIEEGFKKAEYAYDKLEGTLKHLKPNELYSSRSEFEQELMSFKLIEDSKVSHFQPQLSIEFKTKPQPSFNKNFELLFKNLRENKANQYQNFIFSEYPKQIERLYAIFEDSDANVEFTPITVGIREGFIDEDLKLIAYTDHQIFERYHKFKLKEGYKKSQQALTLKEIYNLQKGDFVVHVDHGVGEFSGLEKIDANGKQQEAIRLLYKGGDILYISIHSLHRISKYSGKEGVAPKMNKIGSPAWATAKSKAKSRVKELAFDLIKLYAKRKSEKGFAFGPDNYLQNELEASFMYEDTPDQLTATEAIKKDMESESPMDRLVCGDVGFGKTELAIRAAFKAACDSKQTAILVPTTVLSFQHFKTFSERLKGLPVTVDYVNRFKSAAKNKDTLERLAKGEIDIIIGTHKLVGNSVKFKDLGLMIIDEEQKFGVSAKDKLKANKANVDVLTLSATPIPRTLQFSLMNARDLSILNTAPPNRYPVQTEIRPFNEELIRDAITYEIQRGGQAFFVHNRVQNIQEVAGMIQRLCPDARVAIGHGQMEGSKLEAVMLDFMEGMYDVLVATTIIESGIDIGNANTIIVNGAQNFGLSDLHQLRGRVGRSNKKAFCYLLAPPRHMQTEEARKRLQALEQFSDLGAGFNIAMRDLDIRGAGDLLGGEQSGFISDIGFDMYQRILKEAVQELKENEFKDLFVEENSKRDFVEDCVIETDLELVIPNNYVNEVAERLALYKELDDLETEEQLMKYQKNLIDRFGEIPKPTLDLIDTIRLRQLAKNIGFEKLLLKKDTLIGTFVANQDSPYYQSGKFTKVLQFIQANPRAAEMKEKNGKLRLIFRGVNGVAQANSCLKMVVG